MIATEDGAIAASRQVVSFCKTVSRNVSQWTSVLDLAGNPGAGTLSAGNTANGVVPTSATAGFPAIAAFGASATGQLEQISFANQQTAFRMKLFDLLFRCGAYAFNNGLTTLASQPSFSTRVPGGTDYSNTQIWIEIVTAFTGSPTITVTYTNGTGTTGRTTGGQALFSGFPLGRCIQMPFQSGDSSVRKIESVTSTGGSAGTFNVFIARPLWSGGVVVANRRAVHDFAKTMAPVVYADSALYVLIAGTSVITGLPDIDFVIANG